MVEEARKNALNKNKTGWEISQEETKIDSSIDMMLSLRTDFSQERAGWGEKHLLPPAQGLPVSDLPDSFRSSFAVVGVIDDELL